jgi:hypothetical protein
MSDRTGRRPLGTLTRHPADWFSDYSYVGGFQIRAFPPPGTQDFLAVGLYNDDSAGRVLKVYGISVEADAGEGVMMFFVFGTIGALVGPALSIRPDRAAPTGKIYQVTTNVPGGPQPFPYDFGPQYDVVSTSGFDGNTILSPFPLFIVPQGYSLVAANLVDCSFPGFFFRFQVAAQ